MGMDLVAIKSTHSRYTSFHLNWHGWAELGDLLEGLGCDTSEMSGYNDGHSICKTTCKNWAKAIRTAIKAKKLGEIRIEDTSYYGGGYTKIIILPESSQTNINKKDIVWLRNVANFLNNCGGCNQW